MLPKTHHVDSAAYDIAFSITCRKTKFRILELWQKWKYLPKCTAQIPIEEWWRPPSLKVLATGLGDRATWSTKFHPRDFCRAKWGSLYFLVPASGWSLAPWETLLERLVESVYPSSLPIWTVPQACWIGQPQFSNSRDSQPSTGVSVLPIMSALWLPPHPLPKSVWDSQQAA